MNKFFIDNPDAWDRAQELGTRRKKRKEFRAFLIQKCAGEYQREYYGVRREGEETGPVEVDWRGHCYRKELPEDQWWYWL